MKVNKGSKMFFIISGIIYCLAGLLVMFYPLATMITIAVILGVTILLSGIGYTASYFADRSIINHSGWVLAAGLLDIVVGIILLLNIKGTIIAIPFLLGLWALFASISRISASFSLQALGIKKWWWMLLGGIIGAIFAFLIIFYPVFGAVVISIYIGIFMLFMGAFSLLEAFYIHK
ncbi:uncharacterized membrane protein HdeD (DUF308 family) [Elusimicrobium posterum]|uniref:HdeD family acid-resistance protein n=1 Tax=Elusimicrobium posterum TaxID=3116653 RepID=UPI003C75EAF4